VAGMSFTAIDFETANSNLASVCGVGLVKVRDGRIVDATSWLIKPPPGLGRFDPVHTEHHGIAEQDVFTAAGWEMAVEGILHFTCEDPLVAFDAPYDADVMRKASKHLKLDLPAKDFYCALQLARNQLDLPMYSLDAVLSALSLPPSEAGPGADARASVNVVRAIASLRGASSLAGLWDAPTASIGRRPQGRRRL
jgi:DNA polymerase III epsilon subunit-like protein